MVRHEGVRLARACWVPAEQSESLIGRCIAVIHSSADDSLISFTTAARLHGFWLPDTNDLIHVATASPERVAAGMTRTRRREFKAHRHRLAASDHHVVHGVPVMSPARTWLDLARTFSWPDLVAAGDSALRLGTTMDELHDVVRRAVHVRGVIRARAALPLLDRRSRSRPESHLRVAVSAPDLPRFEVNEPVHRDHGGWLAEPDLSLVGAKLALEYVGEDHGKIGRRRKDISRTTDMRRDGWYVIEYGPSEVFKSPWEIAPEVRACIRNRAPHLLHTSRDRRSTG